MRLTRPRLVFVGLAVMAFGGRLAAQTVASEKPVAPVAAALKEGVQKRNIYVYDGAVHETPPPNFGIVDVNWSRLGATELDPDGSGTTYTSTWAPPAITAYQRWVTGGFPHLIGYGHVPGGALLPQLNYAYCETNSSGPFGTIDFYIGCDTAGNCPSSPTFSWNLGTFGTGCFAPTTFLGSASTVNNGAGLILVDVQFGFTDGSESIGSIAFGYQLQVSPAPATASFNDVPTSDPGFQYVEALVASGITAGCGGGNYCPDNPVTRRQMAVFIAKALGLDWNGY